MKEKMARNELFEMTMDEDEMLEKCMGGAKATVIREGFLCPMCMKDLGTVGHLQFHFDNFHSTDDKDVLHSIRDLFGKAKKKILKRDPLNEESAMPGAAVFVDSSWMDDDWQMVIGEAQEEGATTSHLDYFKHVRSSRFDGRVVETNKLLIRLDKLVTETPFDPQSRKNYEKNVVFWVADADVRICPGCGRSFNIGRRRHHCRLCGGIMCAACSHFILYSDARKLIGPLHTPQSSSQPTSPMHRSGSNSSLNSLVSASGEPHIRICTHCKSLLDRRAEQMDVNDNQPQIKQFYDKLKNCMDEATSLCTTYTKMAESLSFGETNYSLREAQDLRIKLIKVSENIDLLSKRIVCLNRDKSAVQPMNVLLQQSIRKRATNFLQENVVGLPSLPTEEEFRKLEVKRSETIKRKIAEEKQQALEFQQKYQMTSDSREESPKKETITQQQQQQQQQRATSPRKIVAAAEVELGWGTETPARMDGSNEDPMLQQINNLYNFIEQARAARMYDEIHILETNLKELQLEYRAQQRHKNRLQKEHGEYEDEDEDDKDKDDS